MEEELDTFLAIPGDTLRSLEEGGEARRGDEGGVVDGGEGLVFTSLSTHVWRVSSMSSSSFSVPGRTWGQSIQAEYTSRVYKQSIQK